MTLIEWLFAFALLANTVLLSLIWVTLRDGLRMLILQGSRRRQRGREEHKP